jgi:hypothetical protein
MERILKSFAIGLVILIILAPLGLLAVGETFGEWSNEEIKEKLGFVPAGLERLSSVWRAPLADYAFPDDKSQTGAVAAYILSGILGVAICGGLLYYAGKKIAKN